MQRCHSLADETITYPCETGIEAPDDSIAEGEMVRVWIQEDVSHVMPRESFNAMYYVLEESDA